MTRAERIKAEDIRPGMVFREIGSIGQGRFIRVDEVDFYSERVPIAKCSSWWYGQNLPRTGIRFHLTSIASRFEVVK